MASLSIWASDGQEGGARFWLQVFSELKGRGVEDILIVVCDRLMGLPETDQHHLEKDNYRAVAVAHRHLICNSFH